ncbi:MAG: ATP-grasp domain-containing protein [Candidatus Omnitrophota bacterium]
MKIALIYNLKRKVEDGIAIDYFSEFDSKNTVDSLFNALCSLGHEVSLVEADRNMLSWLGANKVDIVFNIAECFGRDREAQVPAICDFLKIPCVGSGALGQALSLDKAMTKKILSYENIPTPKFQLFKSAQESLNADFKFPLIVKPNAEGSAKGINVCNLVNNRDDLFREIARIISRYRQPALVEEFINGRELTVGVIGNNELTVLPILEIDFKGCQKSGEHFYSWRMKEYQGNVELGLNPAFYCPAVLDLELKAEIENIARRVHEVINCCDFSRVDIRLQEHTNIPYVLETNSLPGLDPVESNLTMMAQAAGIGYSSLIRMILESALSRYQSENIYVQAGRENQ